MLHSGISRLDAKWNQGSSSYASCISNVKRGVRNDSSISSSSHNKEKFDCTVQQYNWLKSFLAEKEQLFGIDALYRKQILKQLPFFFQYEFKYYMQQDFKSDFSFSSVKYWYLMVKKFALPTSIVLKSLIKSFY
jgi:hypothetical protein